MKRVNFKIESDFALFDDILDDIHARENEDNFFTTPTLGDTGRGSFLNFSEDSISTLDIQNQSETETQKKVLEIKNDSQNSLNGQFATDFSILNDDVYDDIPISLEQKFYEEIEPKANKNVSFAFDDFPLIVDEQRQHNDEKGTRDSNEILMQKSNVHAPIKKKKSKKEDRLSPALYYQCHCELCPNSIYSKSSFPILQSLLNDQPEVENKKSSRKVRRKKKKDGIRSEKNDGPKLSANLRDTGNPILIDWLDTKNKYAKEKRRQVKEEKKLERKNKDAEELLREKRQDERERFKNEWIVRKKQELRQKKLSISAVLETEAKRSVYHNQMRRPKFANQGNHIRATSGAKKERSNEYRDILALKTKKRPFTSPGKRTDKNEELFKNFRDYYLNDDKTPAGYASVRLFVENILTNAIKELETQRHVKEVRHKRPKSARVSLSLNSQDTSLSPSIVNNKPTSAEQPSTKENAVTYEKWLSQKKVQAKQKRKEQARNNYYNKLEKQVILVELERRRNATKELKKQVKTGLRRSKMSNEPSIDMGGSLHLIRPEPQGSESITKER